MRPAWLIAEPENLAPLTTGVAAMLELGPTWQLSQAALVAEVFFFIHRDGSVTGLQFIRRSGSFSFDLEAQGAEPSLLRRYDVDHAHAGRIRATAAALYGQADATGRSFECSEADALLGRRTHLQRDVEPVPICGARELRY